MIDTGSLASSLRALALSSFADAQANIARSFRDEADILGLRAGNTDALHHAQRVAHEASSLALHALDEARELLGLEPHEDVCVHGSEVDTP